MNFREFVDKLKIFGVVVILFFAVVGFVVLSTTITTGVIVIAMGGGCAFLVVVVIVLAKAAIQIQVAERTTAHYMQINGAMTNMLNVRVAQVQAELPAPVQQLIPVKKMVHNTEPDEAGAYESEQQVIMQSEQQFIEEHRAKAKRGGHTVKSLNQLMKAHPDLSVEAKGKILNMQKWSAVQANSTISAGDTAVWTNSRGLEVIPGQD